MLLRVFQYQARGSFAHLPEIRGNGRNPIENEFLEGRLVIGNYPHFLPDFQL